MKTHRVLLAGLLLATALILSCEDDATTPSDVTSPVRVTDLAVIGAGNNSVTLEWTAPGDDGGAGTAKSYQIRWSDALITGANFSSANLVPNPPAPVAGGTIQQFAVDGIDTTLVTHFALRATDDAGNTSQVSNNAVWTPPNEPFHITKDIPPFKDNTMYEESGDVSNGKGEYLFVGKTLGLSGAPWNRRALLAFAIADSLPAGAVVDSVRLVLHASKVNDTTARTTTLHRVTADWGEGVSDAGAPGGLGTAAEPNDATWVHRFYNTTMWTTAGGDYDASTSAQTGVAGFNAFYVWSSAQMASDVQGWLDTPASNFGWVVIGDESTAQTAKRFDSRENLNVGNRPVLRVYATVTP